MPDNPIFLIILSIINATLAIYPLSSNTVIHANKDKIIGKRTNIPPTPPIIPSMISDWNQGEVVLIKPSIIGTNESFNNESSKSERGCPIQANVTWNVNAIIAKNIG